MHSVLLFAVILLSLIGSLGLRKAGKPFALSAMPALLGIAAAAWLHAGAEPDAKATAAQTAGAREALSDLHPSAAFARRWLRGEADATCPPDSSPRGSRPPRGLEIGCEQNGMPHGPFASWHLNGKPATAGLYRDGQRQGVWLRFRATGGLEAMTSFQAGKRHGPAREYDASGRLSSETQWVNGVPTG